MYHHSKRDDGRREDGDAIRALVEPEKLVGVTTAAASGQTGSRTRSDAGTGRRN